MEFCSKCGCKLPYESKFCVNCGTSIESNEVKKQEERIKIFEGEIHKCPNCGEELKSFEAICPSCKHELRGIKGSKFINELNEQLAKAATEQEKTDIIRNFPVPNTKEDICEFMILASSNFDANVHFRNEFIDDVSDGWLAKLDQCAMKANMLGDSDFSNQMEKIRSEAIERFEKVKKREKIKKFNPLIIIASIVTIIVVLGIIISLIIGKADPNLIKVGISSEDVTGQNYEDIAELFENNGFTNVAVREDGWHLFHKSGTVKSVTIDGKEEFYSFSKFSKDAKIIILYYE